MFTAEETNLIKQLESASRWDNLIYDLSVLVPCFIIMGVGLHFGSPLTVVVGMIVYAVIRLRVLITGGDEQPDTVKSKHCYQKSSKGYCESGGYGIYDARKVRIATQGAHRAASKCNGECALRNQNEHQAGKQTFRPHSSINSLQVNPIIIAQISLFCHVDYIGTRL